MTPAADEEPPGSLLRAREALDRHDWQEAVTLLAQADSAGALDGEGLRLLGKAVSWCGDMTAAIDAFERSYAAFLSAGDRRGAAKVVLMLRHTHANSRRDAAAASGCVRRAERLLVGLEDTPEFGHLRRAQGRRAFRDGDPERGRRLLEEAIALGLRHDEANLTAMSMSWLGVSLCEIGLAEDGFGYLDEACTAAIGGELGPWATGIVYCNTIGAYREAGEFSRAGEWNDTAARWCERHSVTGFPGICRVHRAEFMRLRGAWAAAESEARRAGDEMASAMPAFAGDALYEVGEIRLRMGDLDGAEGAFRQAHQLFRDPQPGLALLQWLRGDPEGALRSLVATSRESQAGFIDRCRSLAAMVQLAIATADLPAAEAAVVELEEMTAGKQGIALRVLPLQARGELQLALRQPAALRTLREALNLWREMEAPYEIGLVRLLLAEALIQAGDASGARREVEAAIGSFSALGAAPAEARARAALAAMTQTAPSSPAADPAERCFMCTDIVGSTRLVEAIGDQAWVELSQWHDQALRTSFAHHGGEELDHAGDGFLVAFTDSASALACAMTIQQELADHRRRHGFAPRVRIGIHATTAARVGRAFRGKGVHEAARIASLAGEDEIVASQASLPAGVRASDPRSVVVKGLSAPISVVTVDWRATLGTRA